MESEQQPCLCCELGLSNGHGGPRGGALKCVGVDGWVEEFADDMMMVMVLFSVLYGDVFAAMGLNSPYVNHTMR